MKDGDSTGLEEKKETRETNSKQLTNDQELRARNPCSLVGIQPAMPEANLCPQVHFGAKEAASSASRTTAPHFNISFMINVNDYY